MTATNCFFLVSNSIYVLIIEAMLGRMESELYIIQTHDDVWYKNCSKIIPNLLIKNAEISL